MAHVRWFALGVDTVLGETGDPAEIFRLDTCDNEPLLCYVGKASVEMLGMPVFMKDFLITCLPGMSLP